MKIKDLIKELKPFNQNDEIYLANDIEGNYIKTIHAVCITKDGYFEECTKDTPNAEKLNSKWYIWIPTKNLITIYPSDEIINE